MSVQKQMEDAMQTWTETQKKMWDGWAESLKGFGIATPNNDMWLKTVETWQGMVTNGLETQNQWAKMWTENLGKVEGLPAPTVEWAKQAEEMNVRWTTLQKQLWEKWFEFVKKLEPGQLPKVEADEIQEMFTAWQEATQEIIKLQTEWLNGLANNATTAVADAVKPEAKK